MYSNNFDTLNVNSTQDIKMVNVNKNYESMGALNVNGSINCEKGIKIGNSMMNAPGLLKFDGINFMGFYKNGWNLLSKNENFEFIDNNDSIIDSNDNLNIIINIDDDINFKYKITNEYINDNINIFLNKIKDYKVNHINILLINETDKFYNIKFNANNNRNTFHNNEKIYYDNKHIYVRECIIINILIDDNYYFISFKNYEK